MNKIKGSINITYASDGEVDGEMQKKGFVMIVILLLIFGGFPGNCSTTVGMASAEGIQSEVPAGYIPILSAEDLNAVRTNLGGRYILMNDIDLTEATGNNGEFFNEGAGWIPLGSESHPFSGTLDGNGYRIIGLKQSIVSDTSIYAGLFGYVKNGKILNLGMENSSITAENTSIDQAPAKTYAGGIVGYGYNLTITDSYNTGSISAQSLFDGYAGGVAGYVTNAYNAFSTISNAYNQGAIQAKTNSGGIAGYVSRTKISNVYNTADLQSGSNQNTGGIVGYMGSSSSITDAYNTGDIAYKSNGGGIAGYASSSSFKNVYNEGNLSSTDSWSESGGIVGSASTVTISSSYNSGSITSTGQYTDGGGIAGSLSSNSTISESYNTGDITVKSYAGGIGGTVHTSVITKVFNTGTIKGLFAGGVASSSSSTILNSFNIGMLQGEADIGGIVAIARSGSDIRNTYNIGQLVALRSSHTKGGIVSENEGTIENSYYIDKVSTGVGIGTTDGTFKVTFDQMKDSATYQGFDFSTVWNQNPESEFRFPFLTTLPAAESERTIDVSIVSLPEKLQYIEGDQLEVTGAKLEVKTNHGNTQVVELVKDMVTGYEPYMPGNQNLTVTYDGHSVTFTVSVIAKHLVTFVDYDGTVLKQEEVVDGQSASAPEVPVHEGRTFTGWNKVFSNVRDSMEVMAQYKIHDHIVTYQDGNSILSTQSYKYGDTVKVPEQPVKVGYAFLDWYKDPGFQNLYSFSEPIKTDLSLYARFAKIPEKVQNIVVKPGLHYAKISWKPVAGVDRYSVWWTTSPNSYYYTGTYVNPDESEYTVGGLDPGKTYYFRVIASRDIDGWQIDSPEPPWVSAKTGLAGASSPKASAVGATKVKLTWKQSPDATGYIIYRSDSNNGTYNKVTTVTETYKEEYLNAGLIPGKTYYYKIRAYREMDGNTYYSPYSSVISAKPVLAGATVRAASAGYDKVKLTWTKSLDANGYVIYRSESSTGTYQKVTTITKNSTLSYTNSGLVTGKKYYYKIRAYKTIAGKNYYSPYSGVTYANPILAVTTIKAGSAGYNKIKVSWTKVSGSHGYEVYRATSKTGKYKRIKTITKSSTSSYTNTSLSTGKAYYYKVRAYRNVNGKKVYSSFSKVVSAKPALAVPAKISLAKASSTSINITWSKVREASGYQIYRSTSKTGTYSRIKTITSASTVSYTNTSLKRGKTYYYKIRAYKVVNSKKIYSTYTKVTSYKL